MNWLLGIVLASMAGAFVIGRLFDWVFSGVMGKASAVARAGLFVGTWTAITAGTGLHAFSKRIRGLRQASRELRDKLE